jgi:hypothetical protein
MNPIEVYSETGMKISVPVPYDAPQGTIALGPRQAWTTDGAFCVRGLFAPEQCRADYDDCEFFVDGRILSIAAQLAGVECFQIEFGRNHPLGKFSTQLLPSWLAHRGLRVVVALSDMSIQQGVLEFVPGSHNAIEPIAGELLDEDARARYRQAITVQVVKRRWPIKHMILEAGDVAFFHSNLLVRRGYPRSDVPCWSAICADLTETLLRPEDDE